MTKPRGAGYAVPRDGSLRPVDVTRVRHVVARYTPTVATSGRTVVTEEQVHQHITRWRRRGKRP
jgi:hypothetical protein